MGLIKSNFAPATLPAFSMRDVEDQAKKLLARATHQANALLEEAEREADAIKTKSVADAAERGRAEGLKQGTEHGRAAGFAEGEKKALAEHGPALAALAQTLGQMIEQIDESRDRLQSDATAEVVALAVAIARRVVRRLGETDPSVAADAAADAVRLAVDKSDLRLAVHPSQRAALQAYLPKLKLEWPAMKHVEVLDDESISPGGCRLHTAAGGSVDADLDAQIDRIAADLLPPSDRRDEPDGGRRRGD